MKYFLSYNVKHNHLRNTEWFITISLYIYYVHTALLEVKSVDAFGLELSFDISLARNVRS